jgi:hypothetical protein
VIEREREREREAKKVAIGEMAEDLQTGPPDMRKKCILARYHGNI